MPDSKVCRILSMLSACLVLFVFDTGNAAGPEIQRCLTREQLNIEPIFSACPPLTDQASVSDESFISKLYLYNGPSSYSIRWQGPDYFSERRYTYNSETGAFEGLCGSRACSLYPPAWVQQEHWDFLVGTLLARDVGTWTYTELRDGVEFQSRTFEVRELNLTALSGAGQIGIVGQNVPQPLVLRLESFEGTGIEDEVIGWSIDGPKGAKNAAVYGIGGASHTDAGGVDSATIHLGTKPGTYVVRLNNRLVTADSEPEFSFTAIDDIADADPLPDHPEFEEGVGENQAQQCDSVGNPVSLSLGNKFQREVDLASTGLSPIEFIRYHNSLGFVSRSFANYWTHSYDRYLEIPGDPRTDRVKVVRPDGKKISFGWNGNAYQPFAGIHSKLEQTTDGWRFTAENLTAETFDADGLLLDITDSSGRVQTAAYDRGGKLIRIESNVGTWLDFAYDGSGRLAAVTDQTGRTWAYRYETLGRLSHVDRPDGTTREYHYEDLRHAYALTGITQENGQRYSYYGYDEQGRAIASYHAGDANRVDIQYEPDGKRIVLNPLGDATVYQTRIENGRGLLEAISGPVCSQGCGITDSSYTYDGNLNVTSTTVYGITTRFGGYDDRGQPGYVILAAGTPEEKRIEYEYDPAFQNRIARISEPSVYPGEHRITTRAYDFNGMLLHETVAGFDPSGQSVSRTVSHVWNGPFGQISATDGPRTDVADVTTYEYYDDSTTEGPNRARLMSITDPNGTRVRDNITYSPTGKILSETRAGGTTIDYDYYEGSDRIRSVTESGGGMFHRTRWEYFPAGDVQRVTIDDESGDEIITQFAYDAARRLIRADSRVTRGVTYSADQTVSYAYDAAGNVVTETLASSDTPQGDIVFHRVFDAYNRLDRIIRGDVTEDFDYNPDGTLASRTDGKQGSTSYTYDAFKRLTGTNEIGLLTTFTYDANGSPSLVSDPEGNTTKYLYDDLGNRVRQTSPDTGVTDFTYNESGQVARKTDAVGQTTALSYDAAGRLTAVDREGSDYDVLFTHDNCVNGRGHLCSVATGWGHSIGYQWNALGEVSSVVTNEGRLGFGWGPQHTLTSIEYPSGREVLFGIDGGGLIKQIRLRSAGSAESILVDEIEYSPLGRPVSWRFANGHRTTLDLDARHRPVSIDVPGVWHWQTDAYDANDNLLELGHSFGAYRFEYDALDRLTQADSTAHSIRYGYDAIGNRLSRTIDGLTEVGRYETGSSRIEAFGDRQYFLDANGNTRTIGIGPSDGLSFDYSSHDRLLRASDAASATTLASYRYDALGQRVEKVTPTTTQRFIYGLSGELLAELDGAGRVLHEFVYLNGQPVVDLAEVPASPPPQAPGEIVIDDSEANVEGNNWQAKSSTSAVNGSYLQNRKRDGRGVYWIVDRPDFEGGPHDVFVKWMQPAGEGIRTTYLVNVAGDHAPHRVIVDHAGHETGDWVLLGNFDFAPAAENPGQYVALTGFDNNWGYEGSYLEADAIKIVPTSLSETDSPTRFIHGDPMGTPQVVTDLSGTIVWTARYGPFGEASVDEDADGDGVPYTLDLRFPGQHYDSETGMHYNYFRDYDPTTGRYLESDPIGLGGGLNTFAYADANPLRHSDALGLDSEFCTRPFYRVALPYARHCFVRYTEGGSSSFGPDGTGPDPAPEWWPRSCQATDGDQDDDCMKREMGSCQAEQYDFMGFNCCHCVERAMRICGIGIPLDDWPNWPVNPGPQPGEPGYLPDPRAGAWKP